MYINFELTSEPNSKSFQEKHMSQFEQGHALIVGVGADLPCTISDATAVAGVLSNPDRCGYPEKQVQLLTSKNSTSQRIQDEIKKLQATCTADSTVVVYFSGHGYSLTTTIGTAHFLMPFGYDVADLATTALLGDIFMAELDKIPSRKMLIILDCCHAGGIDSKKSTETIATKAPMPPNTAAFLAEGRGRAIIASSRANELSYAGKPYSAFTLALIESFSGIGVAKDDGFVRIADMALHTREKVPQRTNDKQHPTFNFEQSDNFRVAFYAGGDTNPKELSFDYEPEIEMVPGTMHGTAVTQIADHGGVAISGNASGNIIVTGDRNKVGKMRKNK